MRVIGEDDEALDLHEAVWWVVLSFLEVSDICRFAVTDSLSYVCVTGYAGTDFSRPGWLRERRRVVLDRWSRARAVLTQLKVMRQMQQAGSLSVRRRSRGRSRGFMATAYRPTQYAGTGTIVAPARFYSHRR